MEDDNEILDWGHEEEDCVTMHGGEQRAFSMDDPEDAVSLGGDEEDEFLTYQSRVPQDSVHRAHSPPKSARHTREEPSRNRGDTPRLRDQSNDRTSPSEQPSLPGRTHTLGPFVHALPPKPVASTVPFVHPSHPSIIEATAMASRADRDKRNGTGSNASLHDHTDPLPPGWELKYPRSGRGVYYYNIHTHESTWTRPTAPAAREKRGEWSDRRDDPLDISLSTRNENLIPRVGRTESSDMSYNDRHYRPGETTRREERSVSSSQLIDSYVPDSYSPNHRNNRPSPPPSRPRERDSTPPSRRPLSPTGSFDDRDGIQSSHREAPLAPLSAQDRTWVARDSVPRERPRERRQRDDPTPPEIERRNPPRDTDRSSALRPRSPASYTRRSQESASTTPQSLNKSAQLLPEAPSGRKSRFSQADSPVQYRQSESRDPGIRRVRTDDPASHSAPYRDDIPSSRLIPDVLEDDVILTHPASDAQRLVSRKRAALPPQNDVRPGARQAPQRGSGFSAGPAGTAPPSVPPNRHPNRIVSNDMPRESARRSLSPPSPQSDLFIAERGGDRDRGRSRWSKPRSNVLFQLDSHTALESSRSRTHEVAMDVDDAPLPRSSDPPAKQIPARRPAVQDEAPRYPRAMLNSDNDGPPKGVREARDGIDSRHRFTADDPSHFGIPRDRQGMERHSTDQVTPQQQKEPRGIETKLPPPGSSIKLSGTNNIPIGARNKFSGNVTAAPVTPNTRWGPTAKSGSNGELVSSKRDRLSKDHERPPHLDDRGAPPLTESNRREDIRLSPANNSRALPQTEPALAPPIRPSRAALGISRFGPPITKEDTEVIRPPKNIASESFTSEKIPESSTQATPPPPSESSMTSLKDVAPRPPPTRPSHLPPRPASPPRGYRHPGGEGNKPYGSSESRGGEVNTAVLVPQPSSPPRKRVLDTHPSDPPPAPRNNRGVNSPEHVRANLREPRADLHVAHPPAPPVAQDESRDRAPPPMHPERALMLQANGLPPRPPTTVARGRPFKLRRERRDDRDHDRAEPLRGNNAARYRSASPVSEQGRYPNEDRVGYTGGGGGGASLLDRLSLDDSSRINSPSLRDRVQLPSKRDREEMLAGDVTFDPEGEDYDASKRMRRRGGPRLRKGRF